MDRFDRDGGGPRQPSLRRGQARRNTSKRQSRSAPNGGRRTRIRHRTGDSFGHQSLDSDRGQFATALRRVRPSSTWPATTLDCSHRRRTNRSAPLQLFPVSYVTPIACSASQISISSVVASSSTGALESRAIRSYRFLSVAVSAFRSRSVRLVETSSDPVLPKDGSTRHPNWTGSLTPHSRGSRAGKRDSRDATLEADSVADRSPADARCGSSSNGGRHSSSECRRETYRFTADGQSDRARAAITAEWRIAIPLNCSGRVSSYRTTRWEGWLIPRPRRPRRWSDTPATGLAVGRPRVRGRLLPVVSQ
jgi:hypothetical protein